MLRENITCFDKRKYKIKKDACKAKDMKITFVQVYQKKETGREIKVTTVCHQVKKKKRGTRKR